MDITLGFLTQSKYIPNPMSKLLNSPLNNNIKKKNLPFFSFL